MNAPTRIDRARARYAGKVAIARAIEHVKDAGVDVGVIELSPDGVIRITDAKAMIRNPQSLFDQLDAAGKL